MNDKIGINQPMNPVPKNNKKERKNLGPQRREEMETKWDKRCMKQRKVKKRAENI